MSSGLDPEEGVVAGYTAGEPNLVLIGFMATGKSTIGRRCARALDYRFHDSDSQVERWARKPVARIFAEDGESEFRRLEASAIRVLAGRSRSVIATGGGAVLDSRNVAALRRTGVVVLLVAATDEIVDRVGRKGTRPLVLSAPDPKARVAELLAERETFYRSAADAAVETAGMSCGEAAETVTGVFRDLAAKWQGVRDANG